MRSIRVRCRKRTSVCEEARRETGVVGKHEGEEEEEGQQTEEVVPEGSNVLGGEENEEQRQRVDEDGEDERADDTRGGERGRDAWDLRDHQQCPGVDEECEKAEENETVAPAGAEDSEAASENGTRHAGDRIEELE